MATILQEAPVMGDPRFEAIFDEWKIPYELRTIKVEKVVAEDWAQVRQTGHRAPRERVSEYALMMAAGQVFPPITVSQNLTLIDGNTRLGAAKQNTREEITAYVVRVSDEQMYSVLGAALNQIGGERLASDEAFDAAGKMMDMGMSDEAIARHIGRSPQHIRNYRNEKKAVTLGEKAGLSKEDMALVPRPALRKMAANISHVEPFKAIVEVYKDTKIKSADLDKLVTAVKESHSDSEAIAAVTTIKEEFNAQGPPPRIPRANEASKLTTRAANLLSDIREKRTQAANISPEKAQEAAETWESLSVEAKGLADELRTKIPVA